MRLAVLALAFACLPCLAVGCTYEGSGRAPLAANARVGAPPAISELQAETAWLRDEVRMLRASLANRDRREADLWRAYVELTQRLVQLQLAQRDAKPPEPQPAVAPECPVPPPLAAAAAVSPTPQKTVVRAINNSQLKVQQKRELIQSMRPARVIDVVNPWELND